MLGRSDKIQQDKPDQFFLHKGLQTSDKRFKNYSLDRSKERAGLQKSIDK
jgi:hypothetical protein